jgi:hypothetical protein
MKKLQLLIIILVLAVLTAGGVLWWQQSVAREEAARIAQEHEDAAEAAGAIVISETGVATLQDVRVPFSSVQEHGGVYSGTVHLPEGAIDVQPGDSFSVGGVDYFVYDIWCDENNHCSFAYYEK